MSLASASSPADSDEPSNLSMDVSQSDIDSMLSEAWQLIFPPIVDNAQRPSNDFNDIGYANKNLDSAQFASVLQLWWNQTLKLVSTDELKPDNIHCLQRFFESRANVPKSDELPNEAELTVEHISPSLGFHQPKNGTCGYVASMHALLLYKLYESSKLSSMPLRLSELMASVIHYLLVQAALQRTDRKDPLHAAPPTNQSNVKQPWTCTQCNAENQPDYVFCSECFTEPPPAVETTTNTTEDVNMLHSTLYTQKKPESEGISIYVVCDGKLPESGHISSVKHFGFKTRVFELTDKHKNTSKPIDGIFTEKYHSPQLYKYLLENIDDFTNVGGCLRVLLSSILSHGIGETRFGLEKADSKEVYHGFRDTNLVVAPFGFCSQNLVNLVLFGHARPAILTRKHLGYPCGFLAYDVVNPAATGFHQIREGYEYPYYPIWVVLGGTHYTTLFGANDEYSMAAYQKIANWLVDDPSGKQKRREKAMTGVADEKPTLSAAEPDWRCMNAQCNVKNLDENAFCIICGGERPPRHINPNSGFQGDSDMAEAVNASISGDNSEKKEAKDDSKEESKDGSDGDDNSKKAYYNCPLFLFNGLPPAGPLCVPLSLIVKFGDDSAEMEARTKLITPDDCLSIAVKEKPDDGGDESMVTVQKFIKCHEYVQRHTAKNADSQFHFYYELAVSLENHFEPMQAWKSIWMAKIAESESESMEYLSIFDPRALPQYLTTDDSECDSSVRLKYEYPSLKWRCCHCYLGEDRTKKYMGYNDLNFTHCKCCGRALNEAMRSIFVPHDMIPMYLREGQVDKALQHDLTKLLVKRFKNLVNVEVDTDFPFPI